MTRAEIQALIDAANAAGGGTVTLPTHGTHTLDGPVQLLNYVTLQLDYSDTLFKTAGPVVEWHNPSVGGYANSQGLIGGKIFNVTGAGIAFSSVTTGESDRLRIDGTEFDVGGKCIDLRKGVNPDAMSYNARFENLSFIRCDGAALIGPLTNGLIDGWHFVNVTRVGVVTNDAVIVTYGLPGVVRGSLKIENCHLQPHMGCPILQTTHCLVKWFNNENEQEDDVTDGVPYHFKFYDTKFLGDTIYYTSPDQKVLLGGDVEITFLLELVSQDGAGGVGPVADSFETEGTGNLLVFRNQTWFGPAGAGAVMGDDDTVYYAGASAISFWARDDNGDVWDGAAYVTPIDGDVADYRIAEVALGGGLYGVAAIPAGAVLMELRKDAATVADSLRYGFFAIGSVSLDAEDIRDAIGLDEPNLDEQLEGIDGGGGTGTGDVLVNHDTGGADTYRVMYASNPVDAAIIYAYSAGSYGAGATPDAQTFTGSDGRWEAPMHLDAGTYKLIFSKPGTFVDQVLDLTVS